MADGLRIQVLERNQPAFEKDFAGPVELGRQRDAREPLYSAALLESGRWRAIIARPTEDKTSRQHAWIDPLPGGRARLRNVSNAAPIGLPDGTELRPGGSCELRLPLVLVLGDRAVRIEAQGEQDAVLKSLIAPCTPPSQLSIAGSRFPT